MSTPPDSILIHIAYPHFWTQRGGTYARGNAFFDGELLDKDRLLELVCSLGTEEQLIDLLNQLSGFFSFVHRLPSGTVLAATDRTRSIPLFYAVQDGHAWLSDNAHWVKQASGLSASEPVAEAELLYAGYVNGNYTRIAGIKQVQAGECIAIAPGAAPHVDCQTYFNFRYLPPTPATIAERHAELDRALETSIRNLITYAGDRTIALPLSGGLDSTMIALMLARQNARNVLTFTYGRRGSQEVLLAERIAARLGLPWQYLEYTGQDWLAKFYSDERQCYYLTADNLCVLPHIQEWPAVWELARRGLVPPGSVFVPGQSVEMFYGSKSIPPGEPQYDDQHLDLSAVIEEIIDWTYRLWEFDSQPQIRQQLAARVAVAMGNPANYGSSASYFEGWSLREKMAKFLVNCVRVYEYWGFDWWLPLWDKAFIDYWMRVPVGLRRVRQFTEDYVHGLFHEVAGGHYREAHSLSFTQKMASQVRILARLVPPLRGLYSRLRRRLKYDEEPMAWFSLIPRELFEQHYHDALHINSFLALDYLGRLTLSPPVQPEQKDKSS